MALQLEALMSCQSFSVVSTKFVLRLRRNCYFRVSGQKSDITIRFSDRDLVKLKHDNNLTFRRRFGCFFSLYWSKICNISIPYLFDLTASHMWHVSHLRSALEWFLVNVNVSRRPSVCRLSVSNVRAPYSGDWNFPQCFYAIGYLCHVLTSR